MKALHKAIRLSMVSSGGYLLHTQSPAQALPNYTNKPCALVSDSSGHTLVGDPHVNNGVGMLLCRDDRKTAASGHLGVRSTTVSR